jgi:hypothetical protein
MYTATVVSDIDGLFMVSKYIRGSQYPLHVQVKVSAHTQTLICESESCQAASRAYARGKISFAKPKKSLQ